MEEKHLRALAPAVGAYLDYALPTKGLARHEFIRRLLALSRKMSVELLIQTLERARKYRITSLETLQRIAWLYLQQGPGQLPLLEIDAAFADLINELYAAVADHSENRVLKKYLAFDILLID